MRKQIFALTPGVRLWIGAAVLLGLGIFAMNAVQIIVIGQLIDWAFQESPLVWWWLLIFLIVVLLRPIGTWLMRIVSNRITVHINLTLRERFFAHLQKLGPGYVQGERTGALVNTAVEGIGRVGVYFSSHLPQLVLSFTIPLVVVAYVATLDQLTALALLISQPLIPLLLIILSRRFGAVGQRFWEAVGALSAQFLDSLQGLPTLKMFEQGKVYAEVLQVQADKLRWITMDRLFLGLFALFFIEWVSTLGTVVVATGMVTWRLSEGLLTFGTAITIVLLSAELTRPMLSLWSALQAGPEGVSAAKQVVATLQTEPLVADAPEASAPDVCTPHIRLENVRFSYAASLPDSTADEASATSTEGPPALDGLSLEIQPGETVALVGSSGAGKTTIARLLCRFYDPQEGQVSLGSHALPALPLDWLRHQVTLVSQESYLFYGTIADNLRIARPEATPEEMEAAARVADIHETIAALPDGYDTLLGERGTVLSGGQAQRVALARAILKDAPILVLDEATSQVDAETEARIIQALQPRMQDKTVIMIAHRLSTVRNADRILVLEAGKVAEEGTHSSLLEQAGIYANLVAAQRVAATAVEDEA